MLFKNLFRRKGRTFLTLAGIAIGVAAIITLGAMAEGMREGYNSMARGSQADLVLSQADAMDVTLSGIDEEVGQILQSWPEVIDVDGMLMGNVQTEGSAYFYIFGYDPQGFAIDHFRIVEGQSLAEARRVRGKPLLLGRGAAQNLDKEVGDTLHMTGDTFRIMDSTFRIVGIYETGTGWEDGGAVITQRDAQRLSGRPHQVAMYGIKLRDPHQVEEVRAYLEEHFDEIDVSLSSEFGESLPDMQRMEEMTGQIVFMAILLGVVSMLNTMLMSVLERTREIGVLRALGWQRRQVVSMILKEALVLGFLGGIFGLLLGMGMVWSIKLIPSIGDMLEPVYGIGLVVQSMLVALVAGALGGLYPAIRATRMRPIEALRYE